MIVTDEMAETVIDALKSKGWRTLESPGNTTKARVDIKAALEAVVSKSPNTEAKEEARICKYCRRSIHRNESSASEKWPKWIHTGGLFSCTFLATPE